MIGLLISLWACTAEVVPAAEAPAEGVQVPEMLPTPFTAEQIRANMPVGLAIHWESREGEVTIYPRWTVLSSDSEEVTIRFDMLDADGAEAAPSAERAMAFEALRRHALFPTSLASREALSVTSEVGSGPGWRYTLNGLTSDGAPSTTHYTFLTSLPGAPVHMIERHGDEVVTELTQKKRTGP